MPKVPSGSEAERISSGRGTLVTAASPLVSSFIDATPSRTETSPRKAKIAGRPAPPATSSPVTATRKDSRSCPTERTVALALHPEHGRQSGRMVEVSQTLRKDGSSFSASPL